MTARPTPPDLIAPTVARFIRLGPGGAWAHDCLVRGEIRFGSPDEPHVQCLAGDWGAHAKRSRSQARSRARSVRRCATSTPCPRRASGSPSSRVACAGASRRLGPEPVEDGPGAVRRRLRGGWRDTSLAGLPLRMSGLSSRLTQVNAYQRTICDVRERDYLVRKINGLVEPTVVRAQAALDEVVAAAEDLIARLHWADFEVLADLILMRSGWQRVSDLGKTQADVDLVIAQPATGERAFVQVKSRATAEVLAHSIRAYRADGGYQRMFFVCHSPEGALEGDAEDVAVWSGEALARRAVEAGLLGWLIERTG